MNNAYQLVIRKGPKPGQTFPLFTATAIVGRDPVSDITINDPEVSRQHARFTQTSDSYQIEDLGSTNGTFVNGKQIGTAPVQLAHGNEIQFGSGINLIFELAPDDVEDEMGLETAVPAAPIEEHKSDPMMVPDFDHLTVIDDSPLPPSYDDAIEYENAIEMEDELDAIFAEEDIPPPPAPATPRLTINASTPPPPAPQDENPARRLIAMGMALILLMMCCCCGFLFFMYQWGGDWLLQQMGLIP